MYVRWPFYRIQHFSDQMMKFQLLYECKNRDEPTSVEEVWFAGCHCGIDFASLLMRKSQHSFYYRRRRWICQKRHQILPSAHSPAMDDS